MASLSFVTFLLATIGPTSAVLAQRRGRQPHPAQTPEQAAAEQARTTARQHYGHGRELFEAGDFSGALAEFQAAYATVANPVVLISVAECQIRLDQPDAAAATFQQYLAERADAPDRADIEARIHSLRARPGHVHVTSTPPGGMISVDGIVRMQITPADIDVPIGAHTVQVTLLGHAPAWQRVTITAGASSDVALTLVPASGAGAGGEGVEGDAHRGGTGEGGAGSGGRGGDGDRHVGTGVWIAGGLAGVALIAGTVFGFMALSDQSDFDDNPDADTADRGERMALFADIAFGVAGAAALTAIILYATDGPAAAREHETAASRYLRRRSRTRARLHVSPFPTAGGAGVGAQLSF